MEGGAGRGCNKRRQSIEKIADNNKPEVDEKQQKNVFGLVNEKAKTTVVDDDDRW
jgi:hypothetical protein